MIEDATVQRRAADWNALFAAETTADQLADIAERHPEFAQQIAQHPNCYDDLRAWADGLSAEVAPVAVATVVAASAEVAPAVVAPVVLSAAVEPSVLRAEPAPTSSASLAPDFGTRSEHVLWGGALLLCLLGLLIATIALLTTETSWSIYVPIGGGLLATAAAIITGRTVGRKVGGAALGLAAAAVVMVPFYGGPYFAIPLAVLAWMVATHRSGLVALAVPVIIGLEFLQLAVPLSVFDYDWLMWAGVLSLMNVVGIVLGVAFAVWMDRLRARPRALAAVRATELRANSPAPTGDAARTNTLAVLALVLSLVGMSLVSIVLGHLAKSQIRRTGEQGNGLATAGLIIGYITLAISMVVAYITIAPAVVALMNA